MHIRLLDFMNEQKLAQDHPCVIQMLRQHFIRDPSPYKVPYNLTDPVRADANPSQAAQPEIVLSLLKNKVTNLHISMGSVRLSSANPIH